MASLSEGPAGGASQRRCGTGYSGRGREGRSTKDGHGRLRRRRARCVQGRRRRRERIRCVALHPLSCTTSDVNGPSKPRNLPTARITRSSLSQELTLPPQTAWLIPILFQLLRLLSVVPAVFGTLWNLYRFFRPPDGLAEWRVDYAVSMLWVRPSRFSTISAAGLIHHQSILTGWQCLQLTTGLLKRWRVYYSPGATLIRLLALQGAFSPLHPPCLIVIPPLHT